MHLCAGFIYTYLDEFHEEVNVLGVELLVEVVDGLVHVLGQRVPLPAPDEVALAPDPLHVLPRSRHRRSRRRTRQSCRRGRHGRRMPQLSCSLSAYGLFHMEWVEEKTEKTKGASK